jgi:hypothetical protein
MKLGQSGLGCRSCFATVFAVAALCVVPGTAAAAIERVVDGGFEAATCDANDCTDPAWDPGTTAAFTTSTGPICRAGTGTGNNECSNQGSAPFSGSTWARLGAGHKPNAMLGGGVLTFLDQNVPIPAGHSATLTFRLRIINTAGPTGSFTIEVGDGVLEGTQVFSVTDSTPGFSSYAPVTINVSSFAGSSPRFRFQGSSSQDAIGFMDSYDIDDISVTTVDPRCATLRAKLKKAKKKKNKRKVRKIRKKMRALGC